MKKWHDWNVDFSYISITDFYTPEQVLMMADFFEEHAAGRQDVRLGVGLMMSRKWVNDLPTKWADAWAKKEIYPSLFQSNWLRSIGQPVLYNTLHYADYEGIDICQNLCKAVEIAGGVYVKDNPYNDGTKHIHAIQLDMVWPDKKEIAKFCEPDMPGANLDTILQINTKALEQVDNDPAKLVAKLSEYQFCIRRVLLDKSMGRGLGMDAEALLPFARAIRNDSFTRRLGIGFAGGLGPKTLHLVEPVLAEFPDASWDAQSKLRPSGSAMDTVDWDMAKEYVLQSLKLMPRRDL